MTTRGLKETDIDQVVDFIDKALKLACEVTKISGPKLVDFNKAIEENADIKTKVQSMKESIENYSRTFPMPGYENY